MNAPAIQLSTVDLSARLFRGGAVAVFIGTLLWSPFPLGGAIRWAPGVQQIMIAVSWALWVLGTAGGTALDRRYGKFAVLPVVLFAAALVWAIVQVVPGVPSIWVHPVWNIAADILGKSAAGTISLNPWRTEGEVLNLASYVMAGGLVFQMARRIEIAELLLNAVIAITAVYALYAFILQMCGVQQVNVFYSVPYTNPLISGPFMLHNSFATYCGLGAVAGLAKLVTGASRTIETGRSRQRLIDTAMQYCSGRGALVIVAVLLTFAGVVASASRAGFVSALCGVIAIAIGLGAVGPGQQRRWAGLGALAATAPIILIIIFNGDTLSSRIDQLLAADTADAVRFSLWASARRMIADAPLLGLGLGAFEDAYPLYATQVFPAVMDKAHCDYLEFAAGIGLPAAIAWWGGLIWLFGANLRAIFVRHRRRVFSTIAVGASVLVAVHSSVDFSLQLPAVALLFATVMGIGTAQCLASNH